MNGRRSTTPRSVDRQGPGAGCEFTGLARTIRDQERAALRRWVTCPLVEQRRHTTAVPQ